ncbi:hypothetical protein E2C01_030793 [Portunus trituberculatus]|uniref:Uncharacterized protein n=1 Tax=Portunus trituberculatus TaxID=210409 RepID=A0A5B7EW94_PORTR|nr:hypothetical protein [Portunus trituberculatus]
MCNRLLGSSPHDPTPLCHRSERLEGADTARPLHIASSCLLTPWKAPEKRKKAKEKLNCSANLHPKPFRDAASPPLRLLPDWREV